MRPVRTSVTDMVYHGPADIGDLYCRRIEPGVIMSIWEPSAEELEKIKAGGKVVLWIHTEPIPPVALEIVNEPVWTDKVAEHPYKVIEELKDPERKV